MFEKQSFLLTHMFLNQHEPLTLRERKRRKMGERKGQTKMKKAMNDKDKPSKETHKQIARGGEQQERLGWEKEQTDKEIVKVKGHPLTFLGHWG